MKTKKLAMQDITEPQRRWITKEQRLTGNPISVIVRGALQAQVDKAKGK